MAFYCYIHDDSGTQIERQYPLGKAPQTVMHDGFRYRRDLRAEQGHARRQNMALWPRKSDAAGVGVDQIPEAVAADRELGVSIEYDKQTGEAIFENPRQEKAYLEAHGLYHRNSYGTSHDARRGGSN